MRRWCGLFAVILWVGCRTAVPNLSPSAKTDPKPAASPAPADNASPVFADQKAASPAPGDEPPPASPTTPEPAAASALVTPNPSATVPRHEPSPPAESTASSSTPHPTTATTETSASNTPAAAKAAAASSKEASAPSKEGAHRVLIIGDSMAATDFGGALQRIIARHPKVKAYRRGKSSTGLARPDYFDWWTEGPKLVKRHNPDLVIVVIGGNDGQDLIDKQKKKRRVIWKTKRWVPAYRARILDFTTKLLAEHRRVLWLELPVMAKRSLERKLLLIRQVQKEALAELGPRVQYLDTRQHFFDDKQRMLKTVPVKGFKSRQPLRQADGIHFSRPGGLYFARKIAPSVLRMLQLKP